EGFLGEGRALPTAVAIEYVAGDLAVRLESDPGFSFVDATAINAGDGWAFNIPDAADQWWHWNDVHLPPEALAQAWVDAQELGALWAPSQG
ncbi:MAG TPA: hypothetical protein VNL71_23645, partial [Chloroflexota bacterium]|nr:hypothetical protein [Chloroflexota bacterium]